MVYSVLDFGAVGDGKSLDTPAIQQAIDTCSMAGGGKVVFPGGKVYRSGAIELRSCVELHFEMGAMLKASDNLKDFDLFDQNDSEPEAKEVPSYENSEYDGTPNYYFIYGKDLHDVAITGFGKIDGNEEIFYGEVTPWHIEGAFYPRVPLLYLEHIENLTIQHVTLQRSAFWTLHMVGCKDILIDGIRIRNNLKLANSDGIDPDHCQNLRIQGCTIECADDCIVLKNTAAAAEYGPCENIVITGCTLTSTSAALKIGTETEDAFRNIMVDNCIITRSNRGISLQLRDKGSIENVSFNHITIETKLFTPKYYWGCAEPISITAVKRKSDTNIGYIKDVRFSNIHCSGENGIFIYGDIEKNISEIYFDNVSVHLTEKTVYPKNRHDLRPTSGVSLTEEGLNSIFIRNASYIVFRNFVQKVDLSMQHAMSTAINVEACENFIM
ncbi:MAG: right-handed parallel beta-helix repeat-containing protein [Lachnospiraceae bacterium]|nr:right-handed parallel beta-helix repeat-containing protein [Lachnospiraceae bacterium]